MSPAGFEPAAPGLGNRCSILLSYGDGRSARVGSAAGKARRARPDDQRHASHAPGLTPPRFPSEPRDSQRSTRVTWLRTDSCPRWCVEPPPHDPAAHWPDDRRGGPTPQVRIGVTEGSRVRLDQVRVVADPGDDPLVRTRVRDGVVRRNEGVRGNALSRAHDGLLWGKAGGGRRSSSGQSPRAPFPPWGRGGGGTWPLLELPSRSSAITGSGSSEANLYPENSAKSAPVTM